MRHKKIPFVVAAGFFILWLDILLAGADHPPPRGFVWAVVLDLIVAAVVYLRAKIYLNWSFSRKRFRVPRASLDGLIAGMAVTLILLLGPGGEPSVQPTWTDHLILLAIVGILGAINASLVYGIVAFFSQGPKKSQV